MSGLLSKHMLSRVGRAGRVGEAVGRVGAPVAGQTLARLLLSRQFR